MSCLVAVAVTLCIGQNARLSVEGANLAGASAYCLLSAGCVCIAVQLSDNAAGKQAVPPKILRTFIPIGLISDAQVVPALRTS